MRAPPALALAACRAPRQPTSPDITRAYEELVSSLDSQAPGDSLRRLDDFAHEHADDDVATMADEEADRWRKEAMVAYTRARDLARDGEFEETEYILTDLSHAPDERAGKLAKEYLAFEFLQMKAARALASGNVEAGEAAARTLQVSLLNYYMEQGQYPDCLGLGDLALAGLRGAGGASDAISRLEEYRAGPDDFSVVVVGRERQRILVTNASLQELVMK